MLSMRGETKDLHLFSLIQCHDCISRKVVLGLSWQQQPVWQEGHNYREVSSQQLRSAVIQSFEDEISLLDRRISQEGKKWAQEVCPALLTTLPSPCLCIQRTRPCTGTTIPLLCQVILLSRYVLKNMLSGVAGPSPVKPTSTRSAAKSKNHKCE